MKFIRASATASLVAFAILAGNAAASTYDTGWYAGFNIGQSRAEIDNDRIRRSLAAGGFATTSIEDDELDVGGKVLGAYKFNRWFALEGSYFDMGKFGFVATTAPTGTLSGNSELQSLNLDPIGIWPINQNLSAFGRAGINYAEAKSRYTATGSVTAPSDGTERHVNFKYGAGLQYDFIARPLSLRAEGVRYRVNDAVGNNGDVDFLSLGLLYRFGDAPKRYRHAAAAAPPPVLVVVRAPVRTEKYCSILDIEFEINLNEIQREEKERLGVVATFLKKYPNSTAVIEGHTDDVGTSEDNMALSQRRAESVVSYLVDTQHIAASRLQAVGYGEERPLADNDTEMGKRQNRRIGAVIACATDIEGLTVIPARITMAMEMEFDLNKADVRPQYSDELRTIANFLKANPAVTATIEGHTANLQGTPEDGMELSERRAESVVNFLADNFEVPRSRMTAEGFGTSRRFAYNTSAEGQQENRRVNIILNYPHQQRAGGGSN